MKRAVNIILAALLLCTIVACGDNGNKYVGKYIKYLNGDHYAVYIHEDSTWMAIGTMMNVVDDRPEQRYLYGSINYYFKDGPGLVIEGGDTRYYNHMNGWRNMKGEIFDLLDYILNETLYKKDETWTENRKEYINRLCKEHDGKISWRYGMIYCWDEMPKDGKGAVIDDWIYGEMVDDLTGYDNTGNPTSVAQAKYKFVPSLERALLNIKEGSKVTIVLDAEEEAAVCQLPTKRLTHTIKVNAMYVGNKSAIEEMKRLDSSAIGEMKRLDSIASITCAGKYSFFAEHVNYIDITMDSNGVWTADGQTFYADDDGNLRSFCYNGYMNKERQLIIKNGSREEIVAEEGEVFGTWKKRTIELEWGVICTKEINNEDGETE